MVLLTPGLAPTVLGPQRGHACIIIDHAPGLSITGLNSPVDVVVVVVVWSWVTVDVATSCAKSTRLIGPSAASADLTAAVGTFLVAILTLRKRLLPIGAGPERGVWGDGLAGSSLAESVDVVVDFLVEVMFTFGSAVKAVELEAAVAAGALLEHAACCEGGGRAGGGEVSEGEEGSRCCWEQERN